MSPSERRIALIQLLAHIDQKIAEAESLARDPLLWHEEREFAEVQMAVRMDAVRRVEKMLGAVGDESER